MDSKLIAQQIVENVKNSKAEIESLKETFGEKLLLLVKMNAAPILECENEKQLFEVVQEISYELISNDELDALIKLPAIAEPFDGIIIAQFRPMVTASLLGLIDKLLDKYAGSTWFEKIQNLARDVIKGIEG